MNMEVDEIAAGKEVDAFTLIFFLSSTTFNNSLVEIKFPECFLSRSRPIRVHRFVEQETKPNMEDADGKKNPESCC